MKGYKFLLIVFCLFTLFLSSCGTSSNEPENKEPIVKNVEVIEYQKTLTKGEDFNEASVKVEVTFDDETKKVYSGKDLSFDYKNFDSYVEGEQTINVRVLPLKNVKGTMTVEVIRKSIKIIMIANSFGDDTIQWVHEIGDDLGIDFTIANLYIGGCVLATHLSNLKNDSKAYEFRVYDKTTKKWNTQYSTAISTALASDDWDYVSLQQGSYASGQAYTYDTIDEIMDEVLKLKDDVKFIWNMTWAYQETEIDGRQHANFNIYNHDQLNMYNKIVEAVQTKVVPNERFELVVPNGTAVQNARTSSFGDTFCRDIYCHLTLDFGRYIAGLTMVAAVAELPADIIWGITYTPGLTETQRLIAVDCVSNALANPFKITDCKY